VQAAEYTAVAAVILATLLTLAYIGRLWMFAFAGEPASSTEATLPMPMPLRICVGAMCAAIITLGLFSDAIVRILLEATGTLNFGSV
jgi:NADH:ubiquinone oxidoreductase subunit 5 (subunit L)/multisubunit Na+/H+ antiporter MnhA subunit